MSDLPTGTVTFLFTDIEGSTNLARTLGGVWTGVLEAHHAIVREAIEDHGGLVLRTEGDAFFAVFRSAVGAVAASASAQRELAEHAWPEDGTIRVRMGMHTGEGQLGGDEYVGLDVHHAARVAAAGHGGQVLLSEATRALVADALPDGVALRDLGEHRLKDFDQPQHLHQLVIDRLPDAFPALRTLDIPTNLPVPLTTFVGRERELEALRNLIATARLVTLTGPGGSGKTRLATEAARRRLGEYPDGAWFVDLAPLLDPELVPSAIASALALRALPGLPPLDWVAAYLRERRAMLLLDNFEQVVPAAGVVGDLLSSSPGLTVVVTSRIHLELAGERLFPVPPLALPDENGDLDALARSEAAALFVDRARAYLPAFELTEENAATVAGLCARLDGLPLAIELAAAQLRLFTPAELVDHLERRLPLRTRATNVPERQRTLRGTIEWSHHLLGEPERRLFARLAVFNGGMTIEAVEAVCWKQADDDPVDVLASLVDQSLVRRADAAGPSRFTMLETIREFAAERLAEDSDRADVERRHREHFAALAEHWGPQVRGPEAAEAIHAITADLDNLRAALESAIRVEDVTLGIGIASNLWTYWVERGHLAEGRGAIERLLALPSASAHDGRRVRALEALGGVTYWQADYDAAERAYSEQATLCRELGDPTGQVRALRDLAHVAMSRRDAARAAARVEEAEALIGESEDPRLRGDLAVLSGMVKATTGDLEGAIADLHEGLSVVESVEGNSMWAQEIRGRQSVLYRHMGRLDDAERVLREAVYGAGQLTLTLLNPVGISAGALHLGAIAADRGDFVRAVRLAAFSEGAAKRAGADPPWESMMIPRPADLRAQAAATLDLDTIERIWNEGLAMSEDEAFAYGFGAGEGS
jgi:predicted ATPase/class 3 adenylate cyclase